MVKIAHRRAIYLRDWSWKGLELWDGLIDLCSGGNPFSPGHCHTELLFDNGHSFTSTTKSDPACVIFGRPSGAQIRRIEFKPGEWDFTLLPLSDWQADQLYDECKNLVHISCLERAGYDYAGVMRFVLPWIKEHPKDWFCTESVVDRLQTVGLFLGQAPHKLSPNACFELCEAGDL